MSWNDLFLGSLGALALVAACLAAIAMLSKFWIGDRTDDRKIREWASYCTKFGVEPETFGKWRERKYGQEHKPTPPDDKVWYGSRKL